MLTTILFTREWIGDAVPFLVVPIAALAFTPLGGVVADKVNEGGRTPSQRYRPPEVYHEQNDYNNSYSSSSYSMGSDRSTEGSAARFKEGYWRQNTQGSQAGQTTANMSTKAAVTVQRMHNSAAASTGSAESEFSDRGDAIVSKGQASSSKGFDGEYEVVEAVEVLMPSDFEYLQRQRQRLERRSQSKRMSAQPHHQKVPVDGTQPLKNQATGWTTEGSTAFRRGGQNPWQGAVSQGLHTEEVRSTSVRRAPVSPTVGVRSRSAGAAQSWGTPRVAPRASTVAKRRMNARDLAAAHEQGRMSRFDSMSSAGVKFMGPTGGLLHWMFGAKARARVMDTVSASRRPLVGALVRVFPFLRSWGGFI